MGSPMPGAAGSRDHVFLAFAQGHRDLVRGCAFLLGGHAARAERLASSVLARRYSHPVTDGDPLLAALSEVARPRPEFFDPPWTQRSRLELVDAAPAHAAPLVAELQRLPAEQRSSLVLLRYARLSLPAVAQVLQSDTTTVEQWLGQASASLAADRPERRQPGRLAEELQSVVADQFGPRAPSSAQTDLEHGRQLVRRRQARGAAALVAALVVVVLAAVTVIRADPGTPSAGDPYPTAGASTSPSPTTPPDAVTATCDVSKLLCQGTVMQDWRALMTRVTSSYVDPDSRYLTGYSFSYDQRYETPSFWRGDGGSLGLDMFRLDGGATVLFLQVASGYAEAVPCGSTTRQRCSGMRFMDGNRFTLSTSTQLSDGIEVQFRPDGTHVITVVAQNKYRGKALTVTRGDLINLVQDPRLRLPTI